jgi:hypothetical protein
MSLCKAEPRQSDQLPAFRQAVLTLCPWLRQAIRNFELPIVAISSTFDKGDVSMLSFAVFNTYNVD